MKTLKLYIFILLNIFVLRVNSQHKKFKNKTVHRSAYVLVNDFSTQNYAISIYENGLKLDSIFIEDIEAVDIYTFDLPKYIRYMKTS